MPIDPSIIGNVMAPQAVQMPDVNAMMRTQTQGMENIYQIEAAREAQAAEAEKEAAQQAAEAMLPAVASAFSDPSDAGLDAATSMLPPEVATAFTPFMQRLKGVAPELRKSLLRAELLKDDEGKLILQQLEPTANMRLQAETAAGAQSLAERRLELDIQKAEAEATGGGKVAFRETDAEGNVRLYNEQGIEIGMLPKAGKPAPATAGAKTEAKTQEARFKLDETLSELMASYQKLKNEKAIVSTDQTELENISARTGSALGTTVGRAVGTKAQTERDYIQNLRMDLIRDIKLATGMSAQELNSNFELQAALDALGDPYGQSFETAVRTIQKLSKKYGLGGIKAPNKNPAAQETTSTSIPEATLPEGATTSNW